MLVPITTYLRIKPSTNHNTTFTTSTLTHLKHSKETHAFSVDHIFQPSSENKDIHGQINTLTNIAKGTNTTILCYGNTGAGKTHTMFGFSEDEGLVFSIGRDAFGYVASLKVLMPCNISIACFEVYNEKVIQNSKECKIQGRDVDVVNKNVDSFEDYLKMIENMQRDRKTAATALNERSSRSHTVIRLRFDINGTISYLHLIDLAGSEDNRKTMNTGMNLKESSCINKSLFVLNSCVRAILNKSVSIPYRDSKLTRILKDSLGGTAVCYIIGCIDLENESDMLRTCEFISRSRKVTSVIGKYNNETLSDRIRKNKEEEKKPNDVRFHPQNTKELFHDVNSLTFSNISGNFSSINVIKNKPKRLPLQEKNNFLSPTTLSKSYKAFHARAVAAEAAGKKKNAVTDYRTLQKLRFCPLIEAKIKELASKTTKKPLTKEKLIDAINSADFFRIKEIKGVGNKKAEVIVKYVQENGKIDDVNDLICILGEKVVMRMVNT